MLKMLRFRRYRVFLVFAMILTVLLVRLSNKGPWESDSPHFDDVPDARTEYTQAIYDESHNSPPSKGDYRSPAVDVENLGHTSDPDSKPYNEKVAPKISSNSPALAPVREKTTISAAKPSNPTARTTAPKIALESIIPERTLPAPIQTSLPEDTEIHQEPPSRVEPIAFSSQTSKIRWQKQTEHWPVASESIIPLPTGKPISIPKIQHTFSDESTIDKVKREERLDKVKEEFKRAWSGYKEKAWMHDELKPTTGGFRDPFNGWAATLVDSLDTLWIMGFEEDFEDAVRAVGKIDFTTSARGDIQVFETTIRYLGGLIGAYDVSGQTHRVLIDKAVELAEVLMGAFDTPNRMPILNYHWRPDFASQPHRAGIRANMAELGSLAMEFTRLAQLTNKAKYYDAIARITNAFEEWQNLGTDLPGVFPEAIDASGCNRTAAAELRMPVPIQVDSTDTEGYVPPMPKVEVEPKPPKGKNAYDTADIELSVTPGQPNKAHLKFIENGEGPAKSQKVARRGEAIAGPSNQTLIPKTNLPANQSTSWRPVVSESERAQQVECVAQGLTSANYGRDTYSMGAGQDSTYEYFSKQWLLLGGLEGKYRTLYRNTVEAIRDNMLYRPMVPGDPDILFSGKVHTNKGKVSHFEAEATHLTCFLGGMLGMGSKLFDIEHDLEIAKRLTDGCVWAYGATKLGIMPETAKLMKCTKVSDCHWNETLWHQTLDPLYAEREEMIKTYETNKANLEAKKNQERLAAEAKLAAEEVDTEAAGNADMVEKMTTGFNSTDIKGVHDVDVDSPPPVSTRYEDDSSRDVASASKDKYSIAKRKIEDEKAENDIGVTPTTDGNLSQERLQQKLKDTEVELEGASPGRDIVTPSSYVPEVPTPGEMIPDPLRPLTHQEFVARKIENEGLPPGLVDMWRMYILRPEAIESVWYMYRITGDTSWQDKGWKMFEHIIHATQATYGHSAIHSVMDEEPAQDDKMESFWLAETLKYFYLLYSTPDVISLDEWVLNTEAHPFKRPES